MIRIRPDLEIELRCPRCDSPLSTEAGRGLVWQGVHTAARGRCDACAREFVVDLPVSHALYNPYAIDVSGWTWHGSGRGANWLAEPFLEALRAPARDAPALRVERLREAKEVVLLNCLDFLYGHVLLKLLNAEAHLREGECGLVVLIPRSFRWLVPDGVAEVWSVDLPLRRGHASFPALDAAIESELSRFERVWLSEAGSYPPVRAIERFSRAAPHDFSAEAPRVTFVWRDDRPWWRWRVPGRLLRNALVRRVAARVQGLRMVRLMRSVRRRLPDVRCTVAGIGERTPVPDWIDDHRTLNPDDEAERELCRIYSESRVVVGVHGSNMLLPSAHAGICIDLVPSDRWGNITQDVVYQTTDPRMASFRYRFFPLSVGSRELAGIIECAVSGVGEFRRRMLE